MQATRGPAGRSPGGRARRGLVVHLEPYFVAIGTALDPPAVGILLTRTRPQPPSLPAGGGPCHLNLGPPLRTTSRAIPASQVTSSSGRLAVANGVRDRRQQSQSLPRPVRQVP